MKVTKVCCQGCGSPLAVDETIRYATCNHCGSSLEIVHDPSVTHTRILEKLERRTDALAGDLKVIQLQNDLELLDREWDRFREKVCRRDENGKWVEPSDIGVRGAGVLAVIVGAILMISGTGGVGIVAGIALAVIGGIATSSSGSTEGRDYRSTRDRYLRRRHELLNEIARLREPTTPVRASPPRFRSPQEPARVPFKRSGVLNRSRHGQP